MITFVGIGIFTGVFVLIASALCAVGLMTLMDSGISAGALYIVAGVLVAVFGLCVGGMITQVEAGNVGLEKTFGGVTGKVYEPGLVIKAPWVDVIPFNVQEQSVQQSIMGGSKDKLQYTADVSFVFKPDPAYAGYLYEEIGLNYQDVAISNQVRDKCREVFGQFDGLYSYSDGREVVGVALEAAVTPVFEKRHLILLDCNLRDYSLDKTIMAAAAEKMAVDQKVETAQNQLRIKEVEAQMMIIEANAIAEYQDIVSRGIDEKLIQWRGQEKLAEAAAGNMIIVVTDGSSTLPMNLMVEQPAHGGE